MYGTSWHMDPFFYLRKYEVDCDVRVHEPAKVVYVTEDGESKIRSRIL